MNKIPKSNQQSQVLSLPRKEYLQNWETSQKESTLNAGFSDTAIKQAIKTAVRFLRESHLQIDNQQLNPAHPKEYALSVNDQYSRARARRDLKKFIGKVFDQNTLPLQIRNNEHCKILNQCIKSSISKNREDFKRKKSLPEVTASSLSGESETLKEWDFTTISILVLFLITLTFCAGLEVISMSTLLEEFIPGMAGENQAAVTKRYGMASMALIINIALKYSINAEAKKNSRVADYSMRIFSVIALLSLLVFFASLLFTGIPVQDNTSFLESAEDYSQISISIRMSALFFGSFASFFLLSGYPIAIIAARNGARDINPERKKLKKRIERLEAEINLAQIQLAEFKKLRMRALITRQVLISEALRKFNIYF